MNDAYQIEPEGFEVPSLPGGVNVGADAEDAQERLGRNLLGSAKQAVGKRGVFHLALSGGGTPMPFYRRLMIDPLFREMPWSRTHLWIVDERRAPFDSDTNNFKHIHELIVEHADIPGSNVHPMPVDEEDAADLYAATLREHLAIGGAPGDSDRGRLDFVLLGMGPDGHTASLVPHSAALKVEDQWVVDNDGPSVVPPARVTMTYPLLNNARSIAFYVLGSEKAEMIKRIATGTEGFETLPCKGIRPRNGEMVWYLDRASCGE